ncbi:bifunctional lysylphosphatidylglycerol synthetase/lysine--tRNA ligase LysX [Terrabacter sp. MAHUQ-38]|uniref:bifunctional lysylphosphatidylglycerol synthetase/lysine--tRNA ligase LysX n=1 Tax=unclassified Terrabacter TaxID=2630222 RepID=UPI00165E6910|nr:bifunctional lysylphosphatidylglycerol synthetase/lysine--tRNA ligase LysX [Terrabacter sp. MAHUQ-38]MBC9823802.1 bifunctional lysylphosphatidylglycerol synthetase/lysine--tRNA ligase LysX [Terrabacter sp. MAHUQ-38]
MGTRIAGAPVPQRPARLLTGVYALATFVALVLTVLARRRPHPLLGEEVFGLLNVPVAPTVVSVVVLALATRALLGRKRIGLWFVAAFQVLGIYVGLVALAPGLRLPFTRMWESRGDLGRGLDVVAMGVAAVALWRLWRIRHDFTGRLQRGSWWLALGALLTGAGATLGLAWLLLGAVGAPASQVETLVGTVLEAFGGVGRRALVRVPEWVVEVVAASAGLTIIAAVLLFLASSRPRSRWSPDREVALRRLLARHGADDSLGYFATRRDKASVFSPDGRAAVTYRVVAGVSLASSDPVGHPDSWQGAIEAWRAEAREFGWVPAVLGASERGARAYAAAGRMRVLLLGDEAVLDPARFDVRRTSMSPVRHAVRRAARAGVVVRVRRQHEIGPGELAEIADRAEAWRAGETERGFSMALGRAADPADGDVLHVTAHAVHGAQPGGGGDLVGVLSLVPWGRSGASLDVMRRSPDAPNGVTELMVTELMQRCAQLGLRRISLNFCMFRAVFEDAERIGSGSLTRVGASVLGLLDRFWQLERLYRSNERYAPAWQPRFLCYDDAVSLPQVAFAAGAVEGFLPWPSRSPAGIDLDADHLAQIASATDEPVDPESCSPRRTEQVRHRIATLDRMRAAGFEAYPAGATTVLTTPIGDLPGAGATAERLSVVGRVRDLRDHGGVAFVTLVEGADAIQVVLEAARMGRPCLDAFTSFADVGDLVRVDGATGVSRSGTPSLLATTWRMEAKALHPLPFRSFEDPTARARQRTTDLLVHPRDVALLRRRSAVVASIRRTLGDAGFLEVETPMLHTVHGGASARPFRTFSNAYGIDLSLRIAPELHLKRLLVAGLGPVFELGRNFRNEGADATHNPEFTSLEVYQPHADYTTMRDLTERLVKAAARSVHGREVIPLPNADTVRAGTDGVALVDVSGEWPVVKVLDAVSAAVGRRITLDTDMDVLLGLAGEHGIALRPEMRAGAVIEELYAELVEPATLHPTFYTDFPVETSPLTRSHRTEAGLVERWDLVVAGMEVGTAYSELTDPVDQRARLTEQSLRAAAGDLEAMEVDEDFLHALELGMPPSGGLGIGVDRLVMLLTNTPIRAVLTFPFVRPLPECGADREVGVAWS